MIRQDAVTALESLAPLPEPPITAIGGTFGSAIHLNDANFEGSIFGRPCVVCHGISGSIRYGPPNSFSLLGGAAALQYYNDLEWTATNVAALGAISISAVSFLPLTASGAAATVGTGGAATGASGSTIVMAEGGAAATAASGSTIVMAEGGAAATAATSSTIVAGETTVAGWSLGYASAGVAEFSTPTIAVIGGSGATAPYSAVGMPNYNVMPNPFQGVYSWEGSNVLWLEGVVAAGQAVLVRPGNQGTLSELQYFLELGYVWSVPLLVRP